MPRGSSTLLVLSIGTRMGLTDLPRALSAVRTIESSTNDLLSLGAL